MDCEIDKLSMEHITTAFISRSQALRPYERCMGTFTIAQRNYCTTLTSKLCGGFVSNSLNNQCHLFMAGVAGDGKVREYLSTSDRMDFGKDFFERFITDEKYRSCLKNVYYYHKQCKHIYKERCDYSHLKVAKLVRSNMKFLRKTLEERQDVYVIYQPRDPRGMINSRKSLGFLTFDLKTEAKLECNMLLKEYQDILQLQQYYPKRILVLRYEDLAEKPLEWTRKIYKFLNISPPQSVFDSIKESMSSFQPFDIKFSTSRSDGKEAAWSWKKKIKQSDRKVIETMCKDFFKYLVTAGY